VLGPGESFIQKAIGSLTGDCFMDEGSRPLISVIMPVYNSEKYLTQAVDSILGQTLADLELIAVDDGSTDGTPAILETYRQNDSRMILQRHSQNLGVTAALNTGLALARGRYIARMDADDISLPERFERQAAFLDKNPEIDIIGSAVQMVDERGRNIGVLSAPLDDLAIRWTSFFSASFFHPTIMLRHSILLEHNIQYRASREEAQDYEFFAHLLEYACGANFVEPLIYYRIHSSSVTSYFSRNNLSRKSMLIYKNLQLHFPDLAISHDQVLLVSGALLGRLSGLRQRAEAADTYLRVWRAFSEKCPPEPALLSLRTKVVMIAAKLALFPPFQPGWRKVLRKISEIEPDWIIKFIRMFPEMVSTKFNSWIIRKNQYENI
jgi:glycosyltransferase involved in cell wall biosynthesis